MSTCSYTFAGTGSSVGKQLLCQVRTWVRILGMQDFSKKSPLFQKLKDVGKTLERLSEIVHDRDLTRGDITMGMGVSKSDRNRLYHNYQCLTVVG